MQLSIITVNYRSWGHLEAALAALQEDFPDDWEIIVVDNESDPEAFTPFAARYPWVRFIANPANSGFGHGCNIGVASATGEQLLFMNPDVIATCSEIRQLQQVKAQHDLAIVAPKQISAAGKPQKVFDDFPSLLNQSKILKALLRWFAPGKFKDPRADHAELTYCDWVTGSVLLMDRDDFDAVGGWCEDYWMYVEDADLCRSAFNAGLSVAYAPSVVMIHAHGGSSRLNVAVKSMTKLEVIISKHVYTSRHARGFKRALTHALIIALRLPLLLFASLLNVLTLGQIGVLRVRARILVGLLAHYLRVVRSGSWLSPRALANQPRAKSL
ncbi:MAG: glycosyltransferase family 2 protein [Gammaproteobacteria bacterium]|nr:glycosyltransferase family 2 protein [Gammaproteobacteria bacterium]